MSMGRAKNPTATLAATLVTLRGARADDPRSQRAAIDEASRELEAALVAKPNFSKAEAADLLQVSAPTLEKWVSAGQLPVQQVPEYKRERIPAKPLLELAGEVKELRRMGRKRGLLAEAMSRLEQEDPRWREQFEELYGAALSGDPDGEFVSAAPGPDWDPEDEWDPNVLDFAQDD